MQISTEELRRVIESVPNLTAEEAEPLSMLDQTISCRDAMLAMEIRATFDQCLDREDRVQELRAKIASGDYAPTGSDILDAMRRRNLADRIR